MGIRIVRVLLLLVWAAPAQAQVSLVGDWSSRIHEDSTRTDPHIGDFAGLPLTPQALAHADTWTESRLTLIERQCVPNGASWAFRGPAQIRIWEEKDPTTQDVVAIKTFISTFSQTRTIWMDGRPRPGKYAPHTWQGFSTGTWQGSMLTVTTTHLKRFFHRRNGVPMSDQAVMTESFIRHGTNYLTHVMMVEDPVYLSEPLIQSQNFILVANVTPETYQTWTVCLPQEEIAGRSRGFVPHYLPGANPFLKEFSDEYHIPFEAPRAGAEAMYPEYQTKLRQMLKALPPRETEGRPPAPTAAPAPTAPAAARPQASAGPTVGRALSLAVATISPENAAKTLMKVQISSEVARAIVDACVAASKAATPPQSTSIFVLSPSGEIVDAHIMDGLQPIAIEAAMLKAKTALYARTSSTAVSARFADDARILRMDLGKDQGLAYYFAGGGLPIVVEGQMIGSIGVGGGVGPNYDELCAYRAMEKVLGPQPPLAAVQPQQAPAGGAGAPPR